jgi:hypothetical protein
MDPPWVLARFSFDSTAEKLPQSGFGDNELLSDSDVADGLFLQSRVDGVTADREILDKILGCAKFR